MQGIEFLAGFTDQVSVIGFPLLLLVDLRILCGVVEQVVRTFAHVLAPSVTGDVRSSNQNSHSQHVLAPSGTGEVQVQQVQEEPHADSQPSCAAEDN